MCKPGSRAKNFVVNNNCLKFLKDRYTNVLLALGLQSLGLETPVGSEKG
jgi:hypothetical protein